MKKNKIRLFDPYITNEKKIISRVLESKQWASGSGLQFVQKFEESFRRYIDAKSCVAVNSGTAALHLALSTSNIANLEVLIPSLTFVSTAHSVVYNKGRVVFVDIDPTTLCIDPYDLEKKISKKTKAIIPVHFGGMAASLENIIRIAKENKLFVVEDAAHASGTKQNGKKIGSHESISCFSFHPVKNLAMPTGGLISINTDDHKSLKKILLSRRWCGITDRVDVNYDVKEIGWNYYMNEFSAAIGLVQLKNLDRLNEKRRKTARRYFKELNVERKMPFNPECSYHFYWILVKNKQEFIKKMKDVGIETGSHYRPIHTMTMYKTRVKLPETEFVGNAIVTLPTHPNLSEKDIDRIIYYVNRFS